MISRAAKGQQGQPGHKAGLGRFFLESKLADTSRRQAFPAAAQHVGQCWELHRYDRRPCPLPRQAKNRSF